MTPVKPVEAELLVVTGMSGAGRSTASDALEDHGWYVVENLPPQMLGTLAELVSRTPAVDVQARRRDGRPQQGAVRRHPRRAARPGGHAASTFRVLFLDANDDVLVRRFEQGRRPHPLQGGGRILDGIAAERELLRELQDTADIVLDTSALNVHGLATAITELFSETGPVALRLNVMSFGFKYGLPVDANFVADARFIPNPHWVPQLRPHTGLDKDVSDYVLEAQGVSELRGTLRRWPSNRSWTGTGGRTSTTPPSPSAAPAASTAPWRSPSNSPRRLAQYPRVTVTTTHRDLGRE